MNAFNTLLARQTASRFARLGSIAKSNQVHLRSVHIEKRIEELKIELPPAPLPKANYNIVCKSDDTIYVSGHLPIKVRLLVCVVIRLDCIKRAELTLALNILE